MVDGAYDAQRRALADLLRRDEGTVDGLRDGEHTYMPHEPLRFVVDPEALQVDALGQVLPALQRAAEGIRLDEAYAASQGIEI